MKKLYIFMLVACLLLAPAHANTPPAATCFAPTPDEQMVIDTLSIATTPPTENIQAFWLGVLCGPIGVAIVTLNPDNTPQDRKMAIVGAATTTTVVVLASFTVCYSACNSRPFGFE